MNKKMLFEDKDRLALYDNLKQLNKDQFKIFYGAFVHFWANYKLFISKQNLFNLRCELNQLCHELDESFPDQYDDHQVIKSFFLAHPYYYMDKLPAELMAKLFSEYVDNHISILATIAKTILEADIYTTYNYAISALHLNEQPDVVVTQAQAHLNDFS